VGDTVFAREMTTSSNNVLFVGDQKTGKTDLIRKWAETKERRIDEIVKTVETKEGSLVRLHVWDSPGESRFASLKNTLIKRADAIVFCFDASNEDSLKNCKLWKDDISRTMQGPAAAFVLAGCKSDIAEEDIEATARQLSQASFNNCGVYMTSAKTGKGVADLFQAIATKLDSPGRSETKEEAPRTSERVDISESGSSCIPCF